MDGLIDLKNLKQIILFLCGKKHIDENALRKDVTDVKLTLSTKVNDI